MKSFLFPLIAAVCLSGCASVMNPGLQNVSVQSIPSGANVRVNMASGGLSGVTPWAFDVNRPLGCTVIVSKAGYRPLVIPVKADPASRGGKLTPDPIVVRLAPFKSGESSVLVSSDEAAETLAEMPTLPTRRVVPEKKPVPQREKTDANGTEYL